MLQNLGAKIQIPKNKRCKTWLFLWIFKHCVIMLKKCPSNFFVIKMAKNKITELVSKFKLEGHPEGGFYRRFFQSEEMMDTIHGKRHRMTSINFLLTKESFSALHLLKQSNEIFYHHQVMIYYNNFTIIYLATFCSLLHDVCQKKKSLSKEFFLGIR